VIHPYAIVGLFLIVALGVGITPVLLAYLLSPKKAYLRKAQPREREPLAFGETRIVPKPQYFLYGLAYVAFGLEVVLLFPWALAYQRLALDAIVAAAIFAALLGLGLIYVWRKGWLTWV
jgi:NADH-quinone oxidoreductase subunit A